jgi:arylsulfatase A-like enzyme
MVNSVDLFATLLDYAGLADAPINDKSPSRSLANLLRGRRQTWDDAVFMEQEETRAIRTRKWLYMKRFQGSAQNSFEDEMYDLVNDPAERQNVVSEPGLADIAGELRQRIDAFFELHAYPQHDLWLGGRAKSNSDKPWLWLDAWGEDWGVTF